MKLYVGPLPETAAYRALKSFFKGYEKNISIQIRQLTHDDDETITYAFVTVTTDRIGKKAIKKLNGTMLKGKPVLVREFVTRASSNDRRSLSWRMKPWKFFNRRHIDRRKKRVTKLLEDPWMKVNRHPLQFDSEEQSSSWLNQRKVG